MIATSWLYAGCTTAVARPYNENPLTCQAGIPQRDGAGDAIDKVETSSVSARRIVALAATLFLVACAPEVAPTPTPRSASATPALVHLTPAPGLAGDPGNGRALLIEKGCTGCHTVRGVPEATGVIGPMLTNVSLRPTLAGETIENTPDIMRQWILDPPAMKPETAMPKLELTEQEAIDLTAFLYSQPYNPVR